MGATEQIKKALARKSTVLVITEIGIERLEKNLGTGRELRILQKLHENGPMTFGEIVTSTGFDLDTVKAVTWELKNKDCIVRRA